MGMTVRGVAAIGLLLATACSGDAQRTASTGGSGGNVTAQQGGSGGNATAGGSSGAAGSAGTASACPGPAPAALGATGRLDLPVKVTINGTEAVIGQPGTGREGREFRLSLFKFFLSQPVFLGEDGAETPAQFLGADGLPLPYELQLVDADDPATQLLRLSAATGTYTALRFSVGVPMACNWMSSTAAIHPLNPDSDMFWTWGSQFMFIRIEGSSRPSATGEWQGFTYHVGYDPAFTRLTVPGALEVGAGAVGPTLALDIDLMLETDADGLPSPQHSVPEGWVVDNLDHNQPFSFE